VNAKQYPGKLALLIEDESLPPAVRYRVEALSNLGKQYISESRSARERLDALRWETGDQINWLVEKGMPKSDMYRIVCEATGFSQRYAYELAAVAASTDSETRKERDWSACRRQLRQKEGVQKTWQR
jgi:NADPH-dependent ferric siderophore reductase